MIQKWALTLAIIFSWAALYATTHQSVQNGDWNDTATWQSGSLPVLADTIIIKHEVNFGMDLLIPSGGHFVIDTTGILCGTYDFEFACGSQFWSWGLVKASRVELTDGFNYGFVECTFTFAMRPCLFNSFTGAFIVGNEFGCNCPPMELSLDVTDPSTTTSNDGRVEMFVTGGQPPYLYTLGGIGPQISPVFENLTEKYFPASAYDINKCGVFSATILTAIATSIEPSDVHQGFRVFPNPFVNQLTVSAPMEGHYNLRILNSMGQLVFSSNYHGQTEQHIHLPPNLPPGIYFVEVEAKDYRRVERIVKTN